MESSKIGNHISHQFDVELEDIRIKVLAMGGLVMQQLKLAMKAFKNGDRELAGLVIQQEQQVDDYEVSIDKECTQILALRQPEAIDLRMLIALIKTVAELERIGDYAEEIANMSLSAIDIEKNRKSYYEVRHLYKSVKNMLNGALSALESFNTDSILSVSRQEEMINREYMIIIRQLGSQMMENPDNIEHTLNVLSIVRAVERVGQHSVNICENIIYIVKGKDVRHLSYEELKREIGAEK
ncbi:MAG: phosphate signaling complex protein PhoU [Gammaproteobacteria bacterium]